MIVIDPSSPTYREIQLLAAAWGVSAADAVAVLLDHYYTNVATASAPDGDANVAIHAIYRGTRVEGHFHRSTRVITIATAPWAGQRFTTPSAARKAVVAALNPSISPMGSGWTFWIVTATGRRLESIRHRG